MESADADADNAEKRFESVDADAENAEKEGNASQVLSTALFDKPAFKNLVCNGLVLAADGKKMSKRLKNYPDPTLVVDRYGADALRLYLINSPVVRAESLRFEEKDVFSVVKDVFLPWYNAYRFLAQNVDRMDRESGTTFNPQLVRRSEVLFKINFICFWIL